ncbi:MAG: trigger factor [Candidatus Altimarinota bacterium]
MKITVDKPKNSEVKMTVELTELEMETYYQKALQKLSTQVNIKGFRPGKVPLNIVEQQLEKDYILAQAIDLAIAPTYVEAVKEQKLEPIARPKVTVTSQTPLTYEAVIPLYPEVKLDGYKNISVKKQKVEVDAKAVEEEIQRFQKAHSKFQEVDRPAKLTDKVEIDFDGFDEGGAPLEGTTSKNHPIVLGDQTFIPGFEEQVVGMTKDQTKEFDITFPKDYFHKPFQSKKVKFKVTVKKIDEAQLPEINAEFAKILTGKEMSEAELRQEIEKNLQKAKESEEQTRLETEVLEEILKKTKVEIPEALIEEEIHFIIEEQKKNIENRGMSFDAYLEAVQKTHDDLHKDHEPEAKKRLTLRFGVQEIFKLEKIEVSEEELNKAFLDQMEIFAAMNYQPQIEDQKVYKTQLTSKLKMEKLVAIFAK